MLAKIKKIQVKHIKTKFNAPHGFSAFLEEPHIAAALLAFALIALFLAILEFSKAIAY